MQSLRESYAHVVRCLMQLRRDFTEHVSRIPFPYCPGCKSEIQRVDEDGLCCSCGADPVEPDAHHLSRLDAHGLLIEGEVSQ